jgi:hypothetical protein
MDPVHRQMTSGQLLFKRPAIQSGIRKIATLNDSLTDQLIPNRQRRIDTQLRHASRNGKLPRVQDLMKKGANPNATSKATGYNAFHEAARCDDAGGVVQALCQSNFAIDGINQPGALHPSYSPLHIAAVMNHPEATRQLLAGGADTNVVDNNAQTPYGAARQFAAMRSADAATFFDAQGTHLPDSVPGMLVRAAAQQVPSVVPPPYAE